MWQVQTLRSIIYYFGFEVGIQFANTQRDVDFAYNKGS